MDIVGSFRATDGVELRYTHRDNGSHQVIIVVPGILMHRDSVEHRSLAERLSAICDVVSLDVRGHGDSGGRFTWGVKEPGDLAELTASLRKRDPRLGVLGFSFGGVHAIVAAALNGGFDAVAAVGAPHRLFILDHNPLSRRLLRTLPLAVRRRRRWTRLAFAPLAKARPSELIGLVSPTPVLIVHGTDDWLISVGHALRLYERAAEPRTLQLVERGLHAEFMLADDPEPLLDPLTRFFEAVL